MYPLLETIRIEDGVVKNIDYHQDRVNRSLLSIGYQGSGLNIMKIIDIPNEFINGVVKCRIQYGATDEYSLHFIPYHKRKIDGLHLVNGNHLQYSLKWANRDDINKLMRAMPASEDILITVNDRITDSSYCNVAFKNQEGWITPEQPLLKGTQRHFLLDNGILKTGYILKSDLFKYSAIRLFNAMIPWNEAIELDIKNIIS